MSKYVRTPQGILINLEQVIKIVEAAPTVTYYMADGTTIAFTYTYNIEADQDFGSIMAAANATSNLTLIPVPVSPAALSIVSITPNSGPHLIGANSSIVGTGFTLWPIEVGVGGEICPVVQVIDDTHANITVPPHVSGALANQQVDVWYNFDSPGGPTDKTLANAFSWT